ncbi:MAG: helix-turn-helix transcriptional regulator [Desulfobacula sp.]|jgi:DNA-binding CsgD family transcriptional regulator
MISLSAQNLSDLTDISFQASEAACMDDLRKQVVDLVHTAFKSTSTIFWLTDEDNMMIDPVMRDIQNQFLLPYKSYYFKQNPFDPINISLHHRPSVLMEQLICVEDFHKTEYYNDFLKRQTIHRQMAIYIRQGNKLKGVLGMHRSVKKSFGKKFLFMGDMVAGRLTAAFEKLSLKEELGKTKDLLKMIRANTASGMILLDENRRCIFSNTRADQICSRLAGKYCPADLSGKAKVLIPAIIIEDCRKDTGAPLLFRQRKISVSPDEIYRIKCRSIDRKISGHDKDLFIVTLEDDCAIHQMNGAALKEQFGLTPREIEIISYICKGFTNLEIADTLFISQGTVKNHLKHIFAKTCATSRTHLIHKVLFSKKG